MLFSLIVYIFLLMIQNYGIKITSTWPSLLPFSFRELYLHFFRPITSGTRLCKQKRSNVKYEQHPWNVSLFTLCPPRRYSFLNVFVTTTLVLIALSSTDVKQCYYRIYNTTTVIDADCTHSVQLRHMIQQKHSTLSVRAKVVAVGDDRYPTGRSSRTVLS